MLTIGSIAVAPGFAPVIAAAGPVFVAVLIPHIMAGLTALSSGAVVIVSRKGTAWPATDDARFLPYR
jgi:hypothetical protein